MEFKTFLLSYYRKLPKLLRYSFYLLFICSLSSCAIKTNQEEKKVDKKEVSSELKREPFSFYESGKPKEYNLYSFIDGRKTLVGYEEVYENGVIKITGKVDSNTQRVGLWESFYEDGKPWSIGEYENGVEIGRKKTWYSNGKPRYEGLMLNGKPSGTWFFWDEKGVKTTKAYK